MRFEAVAAIAGGVLLPILETMRRGLGHWGVNFTTMFEDYLAGVLLLAGGLASARSKPYGSLLLLTAWAYVTGLMGSSFWDQLESTIRGVDVEPHNTVVLSVKMFMWGTCVSALLLSFREALHGARRSGGA
jgi:uncharacterized membrane protein YidH (DUF202 family)